MKGNEELTEKIVTKSEQEFSEELVEELTQNQVQAGELLEILLNTREQGQMFEQLIKKQIEVKDNMIEKLHKELAYYKQEATDRFIEQLMKAVIKVRKDMVRVKESDKWTEGTFEEIKAEYNYVLDDLTDLLEQQNIDVFQTDCGACFDASIHQAKIEQTDDALLDKKVKKSSGHGYRKGEKVLQAEPVIVYQYKSNN